MCVCILYIYIYNVSIALLKFYCNNENLDINEDVLHLYFLFFRGMLGGCGMSIQLLGISLEVRTDTAEARRLIRPGLSGGCCFDGIKQV